MNQEKRSLLAIVLSLVIFVGWYWFLGPQAPPPVPQSPQQSSHESIPPEKSGDAAPSHSMAGDLGLPLLDETSKKGLIPIRTPLLEMVFSPYGGELQQVIVKNYFEGVEKDSPEMGLLDKEGGRGLKLVCDNCSFDLPPLSSYRPTHQGPNTLVFTGRSKDISVIKTYLWDPDRYLLDLKIQVENLTSRPLSGYLGLGGVTQNPPPQTGFLSRMQPATNQNEIIYALGGKVHREGPGKNRNQMAQGLITWAGLDNRYFLLAVIARQLSEEQRIDYFIQDRQIGYRLFYPKEIWEAGQAQEIRFSVYMGPKKLEILKSVGVGLEGGIDFGWFSLAAKPILKLLQLFYTLVHNWGLSIIFLTILVKLLLNPLQIKSLRSMKEMQKLQPKLQELRERYKNEKERLNMEMMQLFKSHKVNPMGGCLPMLLQMPIYIALYRVLFSSIELFNAPFFWFYRDLSAPDPYFVMPLLLGLFMFLQQRMTPSPSADPAQQKIMMIMPIMFTGFMLFLPVGLVLYILVNTSMTVIQQWMYNHGVRWRDLIRGRIRMAS